MISPVKNITETVVRLKVLWLFLFLTFLCPKSAYPISLLQIEGELENKNVIEETSDTITTSLNEIEIIATNNPALKRGGSVSLNTEEFIFTQRMFGEPDVLNHLKHLSGVVSGGDYGAGLRIDGFDPSQSLFSINKVPVFFPYRFGGIFSTFNTPHFSEVVFERGFHSASFPTRLGAIVNFKTEQRVEEKISGVINIGDLSSSFTLRLPFSKKFQVNVSGRISYVDFLLGLLLSTYDLHYNFQDLNLNVVWTPDSKNTIYLDGFGNFDKLKYVDTDYAMTDDLKWSNQLFSLGWRHKTENINLNQRIYYSGFNNRLGIYMPQLTIETPSSIKMAGIGGNLTQWVNENNLELNYGYEINLYTEHPQSVNFNTNQNQLNSLLKSNHPVEARIFADSRFRIKKFLGVTAGVSLSYFHNKNNYGVINADPRISFRIPVRVGSINLHLGRYTQYLHQLGFSQIGLSSDFWMAANKKSPAQNSYNFELDYSGMVDRISFTLSGYWRRILHEPDYVGQILDFLEPDYNPENNIIVLNGYNCGGNFQSTFNYGNISGNLGIGYGIARRLYKSLGRYIKGKTQPGFTGNLNLNYKFNDHWQVGGEFTYSSGRPYTPIVALYILSENLISEYGIPNSANFPSFQQLNLSTSWSAISKLRNRSLTHLINFSLINAYGRKNVEIMTYVFDNETGNIRLKKAYSLYRFLPSLSYTLQF